MEGALRFRLVAREYREPNQAPTFPRNPACSPAGVILENGSHSVISGLSGVDAEATRVGSPVSYSRRLCSRERLGRSSIPFSTNKLQNLLRERARQYLRLPRTLRSSLWLLR